MHEFEAKRSASLLPARVDDAWPSPPVLPVPTAAGGLPLIEALRRRASSRVFASRALPDQVLSDVLWAAGGVNRPLTGGRTAPSAHDAQEVLVYAATATGTYRYVPGSHTLTTVAAGDIRGLSGYQDFVADAPLDLIYIADHAQMALIPAADRSLYAAVCVGAMAENVYLLAGSFGLATVLRGWIDRTALSVRLGLPPSQEILLAQTVGFALDAD